MDEAPTTKHILISELLWNLPENKDRLSKAFPEWERVDNDLNGYHVPFIRVRLSPAQQESISDLFDLKGALNVEDQIAAEEGSVVLKETDCALTQQKGRGVLSDLKETLLSLSGPTGIEFVLHTNTVLVPQHATEKQINVILGAPPGCGQVIKRTAHPETGESFSIWNVGRAVCEGAARGWGHVVEGADEMPIAQIIGRNFYLFVPTHKIAICLLPHGSGADLFGYAMRMAWNAFIKGVEEPAQEPLDTPEAMQTFLGMSESIESARRAKELESLTKELSRIREEYQDTLNRIRIVEGLLRPSTQRVVDMILEPPSWSEATEDPLFERMYTVDHLLHVETKTVVVDNRMLGPYTVRFDCNLSNDRWNVVVYNTKESYHPGAIPHPHIGEQGMACFGNVGLLIDEALIAHHIPRAIKLVLRWLAKGYDPEVARHKIEEWPLVNADTKQEAA